MDPTMPKNDRGASMLRKRSRQEESARLLVNLLVAKALYREAENPLCTAAAIPRSELTLPYMSQLINAIAGSVSRIRTPAVKSTTIGRNVVLRCVVV
jgi:hypothetical protein